MAERLQEIALGIVQTEGHNVLIIQRAKEEKGRNDVNLSWAFPGGKLKVGETKEEATLREVLEETGHKVRVVSVISERQHPQFPVYVYYLECALEQNGSVGKPQDEEIRQVKWVPAGELNQYFTTDLDKKVAEHLGL